MLPKLSSRQKEVVVAESTEAVAVVAEELMMFMLESRVVPVSAQTSSEEQFQFYDHGY